MPEYIYEHPDNGKQITVWQSIHEEHVYEVEGVVYNRVYTIPQASIDTKIDPYFERVCAERFAPLDPSDKESGIMESKKKHEIDDYLDVIKLGSIAMLNVMKY